AALETVVAKMLARDPATRYQTPLDLAADLEPFATQMGPGLAAARMSRAGGPPVPAAPRDPGIEQFLRQLAREDDLDESVETITAGAGTQIAMTAGAPRRL